MKALTLTQPYATLMATLRPRTSGLQWPGGLPWKEIETRSWSTQYRGELVIHAAKGFPKWAREACDEPEFARALGGVPAGSLPLSIGLCVVRLVACIRMEPDPGIGRIWQTTFKKCEFALGHPVQPGELEFGDSSPGRYAWVTQYVRPLPDILGPIRGALGLWHWGWDV
jgi:hypothetical protein